MLTEKDFQEIEEAARKTFGIPEGAAGSERLIDTIAQIAACVATVAIYEYHKRLQSHGSQPATPHTQP